MSLFSDLIQQAITMDQRDDGEILFVDDYYLDWDKWTEQTKLYSMWFERWLCTDTHVGGKIMFFYGIPFGLTYQSARKAEKHVVIFNKEVAENVKTFLESMLNPDENIDGYNYVDMSFSSDDLKQLVYGRN